MKSRAISVFLLMLLPVLLFSSCAAERSGFLYRGSYLACAEVLLYDGPADGEAALMTEEELVTKTDVPFTPISQGEIEVVAGKDHSVRFVGIFSEKGEKTGYSEKDLSSLPKGRYVLLMENTSGGLDRGEYLLAGVQKN